MNKQEKIKKKVNYRIKFQITIPKKILKKTEKRVFYIIGEFKTNNEFPLECFSEYAKIIKIETEL